MRMRIAAFLAREFHRGMAWVPWVAGMRYSVRVETLYLEWQVVEEV